MRVIRADVMGMCFGVKDALTILDGVESPSRTTILGELVHNETVLQGLEDRGFQSVGEKGREVVPDTPLVLITAHGVSDAARQKLQDAGKTLIDTTCPLVTRAHRAARLLDAQGYHVVVIGKPGHVEVLGLTGDLRAFTVVETPEKAVVIDAPKIGIVCQTTVPPAKAAVVREAIEQKNPGREVRFVDTVCRPTKEHQRALDRLIEEVEAVVVVGGANSNNTRELAATCRKRGVPAFHVQGPGDLRPEWFEGFETLGLTAGTSTPDAVIDEVHEALIALGVDREMATAGSR